MTAPDQIADPSFFPCTKAVVHTWLSPNRQQGARDHPDPVGFEPGAEGAALDWPQDLSGLRAACRTGRGCPEVIVYGRLVVIAVVLLVATGFAGKASAETIRVDAKGLVFSPAVFTAHVGNTI